MVSGKWLFCAVVQNYNFNITSVWAELVWGIFSPGILNVFFSCMLNGLSQENTLSNIVLWSFIT